MGWVFVVVITLLTRQYAIADHSHHGRDAVPRLPSQLFHMALRSSFSKSPPVWDLYHIRRQRRFGGTRLTPTGSRAIKRFFEFYPTALDTTDQLGEAFDVTPKRYFHYSPFVRYIKHKNTPYEPRPIVTDQYTKDEDMHNAFVNHFMGIKTMTLPPVGHTVSSVHDAEFEGRPAVPYDTNNDLNVLSLSFDTVPKLPISKESGTPGTSGVRLFHNGRPTGDVTRPENEDVRAHLPDSVSGMNQRSDWGHILSLTDASKPASNGRGHGHFGDVFPDTQANIHAYMDDTSDNYDTSYPDSMFDSEFRSSPLEDSVGVFNDFKELMTEPIKQMFEPFRTSDYLDSFGMFGEPGNDEPTVVDDIGDFFSETNPSSMQTGINRHSSGELGSSTNFDLEPPNFGFDIAHENLPDADTGTAFLGTFSSDTSGCAGIDERICTGPADCSCYGLYFCVEGSCRTSLTDLPEDEGGDGGGDGPDMGVWHNGPVDLPDTQ